MSRILATACLLGAVMMSIATLAAGAAQESLQVGDPLPRLTGHLLTGSEAVLPQALAGKVALIAMGFTYKSRFPVEAWADWYRATIDWTTAVTFLEVPMIGGAATLGRWFIDRGMRKGTPAELHDQVLTVYGGTGEWKKRLLYSAAHENDAYLIAVDREGIVRWVHHGAFEQWRADELHAVLTSLAGAPAASDRDPRHRRRGRGRCTSRHSPIGLTCS